jgi:hypothetical protein
MEDASPIMHKGIGNDRPWPLKEFDQWSRDSDYAVYCLKNLRKLGSSGDDKKYNQHQIHNNIYQDQLYVPIVVPLKRVFEFFEHPITT